MRWWKVTLVTIIVSLFISEGESWLSSRRRTCRPIDCRVSSWEWEGCSVTCGGGVELGRRSITRHPHCGGDSCPHRLATRHCNTECCAKDCEFSDWKVWDQCTATCGETGHQSRSRSVTIKQSCGGTCSDILSEKRPCNRHCCAVNCEVNEWGNYTSCSSSCGTHGEQLRTRDVVKPASCKGTCPATEETRSCNRKCCPQDCFVTEWEKWGSCSDSCGHNGTRSRTREIVQPASCNGGCSPLTEVGECNRVCCPQDCKVSGWSNYTSCSTSCGESIKRRSRVVTKDEECGGECKSKLLDTAKCEVPCCRQDCSVSFWGDWEECSNKCGSNGTQSRHRSKTIDESCNGTCPFKFSESRSCNRVCCPVHCEVRWSEWTNCQCDGTERRYGTVIKNHECNGRPCPAQLSDTRKCKKPSECEHGVCGDNGACHCKAGYMGKTCSNKCPLGLFGKKCQQLCEKCPKRSCHHVTGQCVCPLLEYGSSCQHRLDCGSGYSCHSGSIVHSSYAQCYVKSTKESSHVTCPRSHHVSRCHCYHGCHPKTILSSRVCHCQCHPPNFLFFKSRYSAAVCCPTNHNKPVPRKVMSIN